MNFLIDTNVVSEQRRRTPDPNVRAWFENTPRSRRFLSVVTFGEIRRGIERIRGRDPIQAKHFEEWLQRLSVAYTANTLNVTKSIAEEWGCLNARQPVPDGDGLIAATALVHGFTVVTRNTKDFERTGVTILNPFDPQ